MEFPFQGVLVIPLPPRISVIFHLGWVPPGKNISVKNTVALYHYAKYDCFYNKVRKNLFIHVSKWASEKSIQPTEIKRSSMETIIPVLRHQLIVQ